MTLEFPNTSRNFEAEKNRVRFWGYDGAIEITFYIGADSLKRFDPEVSNSELLVLKAFDADLELIHQAAVRVYGHGRKRAYAYSLKTEDF